MTERYFVNCRGATFIPSYDEAWSKSGNVYTTSYPFSGWTPTLDPDQLYFAGSTKTSMWLFYNPEEVEKQVDYMKSLGINLLRVYLDFYVWAAKKDSFLSSIQHLADYCNQNYIYTQWVLFDGYTHEDTSGTDGVSNYFIGGLDPSSLSQAIERGLLRWQRSPTVFQSFFARDLDSYYNSALPFIEDTVSALSGYESTLVWEVFGDINITSNEEEGYEFIRKCLDKVNELKPSNQKTTVSIRGLNNQNRELTFGVSPVWRTGGSDSTRYDELELDLTPPHNTQTFRDHTDIMFNEELYEFSGVSSIEYIYFSKSVPNISIWIHKQVDIDASNTILRRVDYGQGLGYNEVIIERAGEVPANHTYHNPTMLGCINKMPPLDENYGAPAYMYPSVPIYRNVTLDGSTGVFESATIPLDFISFSTVYLYGGASETYPAQEKGAGTSPSSPALYHNMKMYTKNIINYSGLEGIHYTTFWSYYPSALSYNQRNRHFLANDIHLVNIFNEAYFYNPVTTALTRVNDLTHAGGTYPGIADNFKDSKDVVYEENHISGTTGFYMILSGSWPESSSCLFENYAAIIYDSTGSPPSPSGVAIGYYAKMADQGSPGYLSGQEFTKVGITMNRTNFNLITSSGDHYNGGPFALLKTEDFERPQGWVSCQYWMVTGRDKDDVKGKIDFIHSLGVADLPIPSPPNDVLNFDSSVTYRINGDVIPQW